MKMWYQLIKTHYLVIDNMKSGSETHAAFTKVSLQSPGVWGPVRGILPGFYMQKQIVYSSFLLFY